MNDILEMLQAELTENGHNVLGTMNYGDEGSVIIKGNFITVMRAWSYIARTHIFNGYKRRLDLGWRVRTTRVMPKSYRQLYGNSREIMIQLVGTRNE